MIATAFQSLLIICSGLLRFADFVSDWTYLFTQDFESVSIQAACLVFLLLPTLIFLGIGGFSLYRQSAEAYLSFCTRLTLWCSLAVLEPLGAVLMLYGALLGWIREKGREAEVEVFIRFSGLVEGLFESMPQLIIQTYNNWALNNWNVFTVASLVLSIVGFFFGLYKLVKAMDESREKAEDKHYNVTVVSPEQPDVFDPNSSGD